ITINIISLSGLILGVGMMVDNSIIVIDNIMQRWGDGMALKEAIPKAVGEVFTPMLSSILTTCSVFLPLIFLSGVAGAMFYDQAMAVTIALFSSLLVSVLVLPVYFYALYRKRAHSKNIFNERLNIYRPYEAMLRWTLRHSLTILLSFLLLIPATYFIYGEISKSNLPTISYDDTIMQIDWNSGISLEENDRRVAELLQHLDTEALHTTSMVGTQQFMMSHTPSITTSEAIVYLKCHDAESLERAQRLANDYMAEHFRDGVVEFSVSGNIFDMIFDDGSSDLVVSLQRQGGGAPKVEEVLTVVERLSESLPEVTISRPLLEQNILYVADVEAMALYDVNYNSIYNIMRNTVSQNALFEINQGGVSTSVVTGDGRAELSDIMTSKVRNSEGVEIPLSLIVEERRGEDFKRLHSNSGGDYYPIYIEASDSEVKRIIEVVEEVIADDKTFTATYSGSYFTSREMVSELLLILVVAIALLYFILAAQFESIIQPIIILLEIVIDIFFVLVGLYLLGESLNLMSLIGIVVMSGIIINDSILKVDTINRLRRSGVSLLRALYIGGHRRLKPILMTSLTTILAIAPFLHRVDMGSDLQYPLSLAIIIGMIFGTMVSLFFIPLLYYTIYKERR
ncbi:MAG: efflux RND transporter permease subunit, partial [Rikenellaceae bacterium]